MSETTNGGGGKLELIAPDIAHFDKMDDGDRAEYLKQRQEAYYFLLDNVEKSASDHSQKMTKLKSKYTKGKYIISGLTLGLAITNAFAALNWDRLIGSGVEPERFLFYITAFNALYAITLSSLRAFMKLESYLEEARFYQESSGALTHANLDYANKWENYVYSFGNTGQACVNASILSSNLVEEERRLRELIFDKGGAADSSGKT